VAISQPLRELAGHEAQPLVIELDLVGGRGGLEAIQPRLEVAAVAGRGSDGAARRARFEAG
jgi:hypothetical protein